MSSRTFKLTTTASTNLTQIGNAAPQITGIIASSAAAVSYIKFYWGNSQSFSSNKDVPTVGTDVPAMTIAVPPGTTTPTLTPLIWGGDSGPRGNGNLFIAVTGGIADNDSSNAAAGIVVTVTWQ